MIIRRRRTTKTHVAAFSRHTKHNVLNKSIHFGQKHLVERVKSGRFSCAVSNLSPEFVHQGDTLNCCVSTGQLGRFFIKRKDESNKIHCMTMSY